MSRFKTDKSMKLGERVTFRCQTGELAYWIAAATALNLGLSDYIRKALNESALDLQIKKYSSNTDQLPVR